MLLERHIALIPLCKLLLMEFLSILRCRSRNHHQLQVGRKPLGGLSYLAAYIFAIVTLLSCCQSTVFALQETTNIASGAFPMWFLLAMYMCALQQKSPNRVLLLPRSQTHFVRSYPAPAHPSPPFPRENYPEPGFSEEAGVTDPYVDFAGNMYRLFNLSMPDLNDSATWTKAWTNQMPSFGLWVSEVQRLGLNASFRLMSINIAEEIMTQAVRLAPVVPVEVMVAVSTAAGTNLTALQASTIAETLEDLVGAHIDIMAWSTQDALVWGGAGLEGMRKGVAWVQAGALGGCHCMSNPSLGWAMFTSRSWVHWAWNLRGSWGPARSNVRCPWAPGLTKYRSRSHQPVQHHISWTPLSPPYPHLSRNSLTPRLITATARS